MKVRAILPGKRSIVHALSRHLVPNLGTVLVVALLLFATRAGAQAPVEPEVAVPSRAVISYQGRLADSEGNPVNESVYMTFSLYDTPSGGVPLWRESHGTVLVREGLFHVLLGSVSPIPPTVFTDHDTLYLGISVEGGPEMGPREQLASVPYAWVARTLARDATAAGSLTVEGALTVMGTDLMLRGRESGGTGNLGRALVDGGSGIGLVVNYANDFGRVRVEGDTTVIGHLRFGTHRQDDEDDRFQDETKIMSGWGYIRADEDEDAVHERVAFPEPFAEPPIVLVSSIGLSLDRPDSIEDFFGHVAREHITASDVSETDFRVTCARADGSNFVDEDVYFGYAWVAIGR
ncbi:MAG TPA: hypothetical protein EYP55_00380 [Anaerolineae bacterium]|nr:hypothetical protein [Anaerolineae bacterium]